MPSLARPPVFPLPTPALYLSSSFLCLQAHPGHPRSPQPEEGQINPSPGQQHRKYTEIRESLAIPEIVFNDPLNSDNSPVIVQTRNFSKYLHFSLVFSHFLAFPVFLPNPSVHFIDFQAIITLFYLSPTSYYHNPHITAQLIPALHHHATAQCSAARNGIRKAPPAEKPATLNDRVGRGGIISLLGGL